MAPLVRKVGGTASSATVEIVPPEDFFLGGFFMAFRAISASVARIVSFSNEIGSSRFQRANWQIAVRLLAIAFILLKIFQTLEVTAMVTFPEKGTNDGITA